MTGQDFLNALREKIAASGWSQKLKSEMKEKGVQQAGKSEKPMKMRAAMEAADKKHTSKAEKKAALMAVLREKLAYSHGYDAKKKKKPMKKKASLLDQALELFRERND